MSSELSQQKTPYARALPATVEIAEQREHLDVDDGVIQCEECGSRITIDPQDHTEYGHHRKSYREGRPDRCSHRPERLDEKR